MCEGIQIFEPFFARRVGSKNPTIIFEYSRLCEEERRDILKEFEPSI